MSCKRSLRDGRKLTEVELKKAAQIMYDENAVSSCTVFDGKGLPICSMWKDLPSYDKNMAVQGLKKRVSREGLDGYIDRKKREVPSASGIYERTLIRLKNANLLD